jgi:hypothetical protein
MHVLYSGIKLCLLSYRKNMDLLCLRTQNNLPERKQEDGKRIHIVELRNLYFSPDIRVTEYKIKISNKHV